MKTIASYLGRPQSKETLKISEGIDVVDGDSHKTGNDGRGFLSRMFWKRTKKEKTKEKVPLVEPDFSGEPVKIRVFGDLGDNNNDNNNNTRVSENSIESTATVICHDPIPIDVIGAAKSVPASGIQKPLAQSYKARMKSIGMRSNDTFRPRKFPLESCGKVFDSDSGSLSESDTEDDDSESSDTEPLLDANMPLQLNTAVTEWMDKQPSAKNGKRYNRGSKTMSQLPNDVKHVKEYSRRVATKPDLVPDMIQKESSLDVLDDLPLGEISASASVESAPLNQPEEAVPAPTQEKRIKKKKPKAPSSLRNQVSSVPLVSSTPALNPMLVYQMQMMQQFQLLEMQQRQLQIQQQHFQSQQQQQQQQQIQKGKNAKRKTLVNFSSAEMDRSPGFKAASAHTSEVRQRALEQEILRIRGQESSVIR
ncbi:hypothetical protein BDR26DRAFT_865567 [Obelidium mucronatum]|nr:hypothetical protein BDR26DRAFT_865567 [Obelidium mucronatum]